MSTSTSMTNLPTKSDQSQKRNSRALTTATSNKLKKSRLNIEKDEDNRVGPLQIVEQGLDENGVDAKIVIKNEDVKHEIPDEDEMAKKRSLINLPSSSSSSPLPPVDGLLALEASPSASLNLDFLSSLLDDPIQNLQRGNPFQRESESSGQFPPFRLSREICVAHAQTATTSFATTVSAAAEMRKNLSDLEKMGLRHQQTMTTLAEEVNKIREDYGNDISQLQNVSTTHQEVLGAHRDAIQRISNQQVVLGQYQVTFGQQMRRRLELLEQAQNANRNRNQEPEIVRGQVSMGIQQKPGWLCEFCHSTYTSKYYLIQKHTPKCRKNPINARPQSSAGSSA